MEIDHNPQVDLLATSQAKLKWLLDENASGRLNNADQLATKVLTNRAVAVPFTIVEVIRTESPLEG